MKKSRKQEWICWLTGLAPLVISLCCLPSLPEKIPTHWNFAGEVDQYSGRWFALFLPLMTLGCNVLFVLLPKLDPKRENYEKFGHAYGVFRVLFNLFMLVVNGVTLYSAYRPGELPVGRIIPAAVGILLCVIGNYMPKFRHNYFVGIRTPWTLASETVWYKTHRLGGVCSIVGGLIIAVTPFFLPEPALAAMLIAAMIVMVMVPTVCSYFLFRKEKKTHEG